MKYIVKAIGLLLLISVKLSAQGPAETIPEFNFFKLDESSFTNKNLETGKMLFFVFFDSDCDHCQHAISYINQHIAEFKKTPIYLITLDSREKINQFMVKYGANLKDKKNIILLQDRKYEFLPKFKPRKYPSMYLYSAQKKLIHYDDEPENISMFVQEINKAAK